MNHQSNLSTMSYCFFCIVIVGTLSLLPVWVGLLICAIFLFYNKPDSLFNHLMVFVITILSAIFISSINISGDVENYNEIFLNVYKSQYVNEFTYEPFLIVFYRLLKLSGASFSDVLFIQSLIMNLFLLYAMIKTFGRRGVSYYPLILIYPQFIQLSLYLSRQSWAVIFIIVCISLFDPKKLNPLKRLFFSILAISAHSISFLYILLQSMSKLLRKHLGWRILLIIWILSIILPVTVELVQNTFSGIFSYSSLVDRKIGFYLNTINGNEDSSTLSILSLSIIPLHLIFFLNLFRIYKDKIISEQFTPIVLFVMLYFIVLLTINYPLLPGRIGLIIIMFSPYFYFYTVHHVYNKSNIKNILNSFGFILIAIMFVRFLYTNDFGDYNVKLANGNLFSFSVFGIFD